MPVSVRSAVLPTILLLFAQRARVAHGLDASDVLVLYNAQSADGQQVANYYAQVHPGVQLLGLQNVSSDEEISAETYLSTIRPQILPALTSSIDVIVTTKGLPLRINAGARPADSTSYDWKRYSSLESELTRIDSIDTVAEMGDQFWAPAASLPANPYYQVSQNFAHEVQGTRLTSRLDGFSVGDVKGAIDRAQRAVITHGTATRFVLDDDPAKNYDLMPSLANNVLTPQGFQYTYDNTSAFIGSSEGPVIGYVSHGRNQSSTPANYIVDSQAGLQFSLADGAIFHTWESFNAYSFVEGGNRSGQGLVGEWLARGGTAAVGHVQEPWASLFNVTNEDRLIAMLLDGYTLAEAAWSATRQLSFVNTVVGDPLMTWRLLGDMNGDRSLNNFDIHAFELALTDRARYLSTYPGLTDYVVRGDADRNGVLDNFDIETLEGLLSENSLENSPVPEPATYVLAMLAGLFLAPQAIARARRRRALPHSI